MAGSLAAFHKNEKWINNAWAFKSREELRLRKAEKLNCSGFNPAKSSNFVAGYLLQAG